MPRPTPPERLGFSTVWTTDHVLVPQSAGGDYGRIYEAILTLAWVGARYHAGPPRDERHRRAAAERDRPGQGARVARLAAAVAGSAPESGSGWNEVEFANLGIADRFHVRGAYLDETIRLWRHLWSGSTEPFEGRFHPLTDFVFGPLPAQRAGLPILVGGRAEPALRRAGRSPTATTRARRVRPPTPSGIPTIRAPRRPPAGRCRRCPPGSASSSTPPRARATRCAAQPDEIAAEIAAWAGLGVTHLALWFGTTDAAEVVAQAERFDREVVPIAAGG